MRLLEYPINESDARVLEKLKHKIDCENDRELIDNAITLLHWAIEEAENGRKIASLDPKSKSYRVLEMKALRKAAKTRRAA